MAINAVAGKGASCLRYTSWISES